MDFITEDGLVEWLAGLTADLNLVAPRDVEGVTLYQPVNRSAQIEWAIKQAPQRPVLSIKDAFFPPTERLLTIEKTGQEIKLSETRITGEQVIFGVRGCDARGVKALDALFIDTQPVDTHYASRRASATLVGLACKQLGETCFCTSVGGGPADNTGMDLMLYPHEDGYIVEAVTEKGLDLLGQHPLGIATRSWGEDLPEAYRNPSGGEYSRSDRSAWAARFEDGYWESMSERCLSCRICAYVCPVCRCFDVRDEMLASDSGQMVYERIRCWDSCAGEAYRRIAGGHNPRAAKGQRLRNRFYCKFVYYPEQYGPEACTGCGRCIDYCPVNIDITEVMQHLMEVSV